MITIKSYTDIEQSKNLAEILPLKSADYCWGIDDKTLHYNSSPYPCAWKDYTCKEYYIPCWSIAALLKLMPKIGAHEPMLRKLYYISEPTERYICQYSLTDMTSEYDNPIDACYEMILKLNKLKML